MRLPEKETVLQWLAFGYVAALIFVFFGSLLLLAL